MINMKPEEFDQLAKYGNKDMFKKRLKEGYTKVAFGGGDWIRNNYPNMNIVRLWIFYHLDGRIATYEHLKDIEFLDGYATIIYRKPFEGKYTEVDFRKYVESLEMVIGERKDLAQIIQNCEIKNE